MKNLALVFLTLVLVSGCTTHDFSKKYYSKDPNHEWSGGILFHGYHDNKTETKNADKVDDLIKNFCDGRNYKKISKENSVDLDCIIWPFCWIKNEKLEFECINDPKK